MKSWLLSFLNSWGSIFSSGSGGFTSGSDREETVGEGTNDWSVVDDVVGGVGGSVLLDGDLGHVVDLVVNLVTDMVDNGGGGDDSWSSNGSVVVDGGSSNGSDDSNGGGLNLNSLDSRDRGSGNGVGGSRDNGGSVVGDNWNGSVGNSDCGGGSNSGYVMQTSGGDTIVEKNLRISLGFGDRGSIAAGHKGKDDKALHCVDE